MATVYKTTGSKTWQASFRDSGGRQISRSTGETNRRKAMVKAVAFETAARAGKSNPSRLKKILTGLLSLCGESMETYTIKDWLRSWVAGKKGVRARGTVARYEGIVESFIGFLKGRADLAIEDLRIEDVREFRDARLADGVAHESANLTLRTLRTALNAAIAQGKLVHSPANAVDFLGKGNTIRTKFSQAQIQDILAVADHEWKGFILVGYYVGARIGTCAKLKFADIDWRALTLTYVPGKQNSSKKPTSITIPIHPELARYLASLDRTTEAIFPTLSKTPVSGKTGLSLKFRALMEKAGVVVTVKKAAGKKGRKVFSLSFHSLRHTFNSDLANARIPQEIRQKLIGHASADVNDQYTHVELETLRQAIGTLPALKRDGGDSLSKKKQR